MTENAPPVLAQRIVRFVLIAVLVMVVCAPVFFRGIRVEGGAMLPSLASHTDFLLDMRAYGLRLPFVGPITRSSEPMPGDVVVTEAPDGRIVKRVIGVGGDRIAVSGQRVRRNGVVITGAYAPCADPRVGGEVCATESIDGRSWQVAVSSPSSMGDLAETTVSAGHVFVMGDHRDQSNDSRNPRLGPVPYERVVGRAVAVYRTDLDGFVWRRLD